MILLGVLCSGRLLPVLARLREVVTNWVVTSISTIFESASSEGEGQISEIAKWSSNVSWCALIIVSESRVCTNCTSHTDL